MTIGICMTSGSGLWTKVKKAVGVHRIEVSYYDEATLEQSEYGELRAYFNLADWDVKKNGLIYTDPLWMVEFKKLLQANGFTKVATDDVDYSEQGMQGQEYVSMDIGVKFLRECSVLYRFFKGQEQQSFIKVCND